MPITVYEYANCDTCRKALKFLQKHGVKFQKRPIVDEPPSAAELKTMLGYLKKDGGSFKNLFNTSGQLYRELGIAEKLKAGLDEDDALKLLAKNGKLIKRPFLLTGTGGAVGFREDVWAKLLL